MRVHIRYILIAAVSLTCLAFLGIAQTVVQTENPQPTINFSNTILPLLTENCADANCHSGSQAWMDLNLADEKRYENLVNRYSKEVNELKLIVPFKPDSSYLLHKIKGIQAKGARMPYKKESLTKQEIVLIEKWIKQGALKN